MSLASRPSTPPPSAQREATISVAVYRPLDDRDPAHWAIHICSPTGRRTVQQIALDERGDYCVDSVRWRVQPNRSRLHHSEVECSTIPASLVAAAQDLIQVHRVDNDSAVWNCQAWVLECLEALRRAGILRTRWVAVQRMRRLGQRWQ